jgi:hypothetical protein
MKKITRSVMTVVDVNVMIGNQNDENGQTDK